MTATQRAAMLQRLSDIEAANDGLLTAEDVVRDTQGDPHSPLRVFPDWDWDDASAAHKHRLDVARKLIRSVKVRETINRVSVEVPVWVRDTENPRAQGYRRTATLVNERDKARATILAEFKRIEGTMRRTKAIATYLDLEDELEALLASVTIFIEERLAQAA